MVGPAEHPLKRARQPAQRATVAAASREEITPPLDLERPLAATSDTIDTTERDAAAGARRRRDAQLPSTLLQDPLDSARSSDHASRPADGPIAPLDARDRIGRFALLRQLGAGGMGVVYSAFDEVLERRVAIKLVRRDRGDERWQARILREAQALARLSHPNVVQVYDAGEYERQIYVAMEYVKGGSLSSWLHERLEGRAPREIAPVLDVFLQAGRGLAAAHAVGLVHRDFKPDNALVGEDGRARVVDFGLVAARDQAVEDAARTTSGEALGDSLRVSSTASALCIELTEDGTVMGTPAYMSPEQFLGVSVDARSDQFSFCVALYEALHGARPFPGKDYGELLRNVTRGIRDRTIRENRAVPQRVRAAIERGLQINPADRWPSMDALLDVLTDDPARRRRRWYAAGVVAVLGAGAAFGVNAHEARARARCEATGAAALAAWDADARQRVERAFRNSGSPHATATWMRTNDKLSEWTERWAAARTASCLAARDDDLIAARQVTCLDRQLFQLRAFVDAFSRVDRKSVSAAVRSASGLPPVSQCESPQWLLAEVEPRGGEAQRAAVERERGRLSTVHALQFVGEYQEARALVEEVLAVADELGEASLRAEALLLRAEALRKAGEYARAEEDARAAFYLAGRIGHDRVALDAAIALIGIVGYDQRDAAAIETWAPLAEMLLARLGLEQAMLAGTFQLSFGAALRRKQDNERALARYQSALAIYERTLGPRDPAVAQVLSNIGATMYELGREGEGLEHLERGLEISVEALGERHPDVGVMLGNIGVIYTAAGEHERALEYLQRALSIDEETLGAIHPSIGVSVLNLGEAYEKLGQLEQAAASYERARSIFVTTLGPEHAYVAFAMGSLAQIAHARGELERALDLFERALPLIPDTPEFAEPLAVLRFSFARALTDAGRELPRAIEMAKQAAAAHEARGLPGAAQLAEVRAWLAERDAAGAEPGPAAPQDP